MRGAEARCQKPVNNNQNRERRLINEPNTTCLQWSRRAVNKAQHGERATTVSEYRTMGRTVSARKSKGRWHPRRDHGLDVMFQAGEAAVQIQHAVRR